MAGLLWAVVLVLVVLWLLGFLVVHISSGLIHLLLLIALIQIFFYELLPAQLHLAMIAAALSLRELKAPAALRQRVAAGPALRGRRGVVGAG